ncbi:unnamed protein product [Caenorhabditis auriculariae]|uniref:Receptor L-domain domain-containing protein n=1 Tax=Caenorhabditis auriculariae TaxID=2777116 RepID=A0A8S1HBU6_9PELO|nr:unnamed protein product [Caenorhabditis auriculariae]
MRLVLLIMTIIKAFSADQNVPEDLEFSDVCCKGPMVALNNTEAIPHECRLPLLICTKAPIYAEDARYDGAVKYLLYNLRNSSTITIIKSEMSVNHLIEVTHGGPGAAITLKNAKLGEDSFENLKKITVDDPYIYCDGKNKLIDIEGDYNKIVIDRLEKVANETLAVCDKPRPVTGAVTIISPVEPAAVVCQKEKDPLVAEKCPNCDVALYLAGVAILFLSLICISLSFVCVKMYRKLRSRDNRLVSAEALTPRSPSPRAPNAEEPTLESPIDRRTAGAEEDSLDRIVDEFRNISETTEMDSTRVSPSSECLSPSRLGSSSYVKTVTRENLPDQERIERENEICEFSKEKTWIPESFRFQSTSLGETFSLLKKLCSRLNELYKTRQEGLEEKPTNEIPSFQIDCDENGTVRVVFDFNLKKKDSPHDL